MRLLLLLLLATCSFGSWAQTYCYITAIEVIPETPTTADELSLQVFGDFSNTASHIASHSISIDGNTIFLEINCESGFGSTVIVPFDTIFPLGSLAAGDYTIELSGDFSGDFVEDPSDFDFTVSGVDGLVDSQRAAFGVQVSDKKLTVIRPVAVGPAHLSISDNKGVIALARYNVGSGETVIDIRRLAPGTYILSMNGIGKQFIVSD